MCGFVGFIDGRPGRAEELRSRVRRMADTLAHRGPDDEGDWLDANAGVALGFRRLSIIELSEAGHQPMVSRDGRFVLLFNGEVYNYRELGRALALAPGELRSDSRVLVEAIARFGVEAALPKVDGMFAFAVWDRERRELSLARDRLGEKPLYYGHLGGALYFGSELKALRADPGFHPDIDRDVLALYLRHNFVPSPFSIYQGVRKLAPGSFLTVRPGREPAAPTSYWSIREVAASGLASPLDVGDVEAVDLVDRAVRRAVRSRMVADVPVGAFLSGGVDSSAVVAAMRAEASGTVRTFTIGFDDERYDEAEAAGDVARHLGTDHTELYVGPEDALALVPRLARIYDEPFADSSQLPMYLVSELAKRDVTVALSGDGGDELFSGYARHLFLDAAWRRLARLPASMRTVAGRLLLAVPTKRWDQIAAAASVVSAGVRRQQRVGDRLHRLAPVLGSSSAEATYDGLLAVWPDAASVVPGARHLPTVASDAAAWLPGGGPLAHAAYVDTAMYLPDDILTKVDRAAMAVSLETRVPMLDPNLVELAWRLPMATKVRDGEGKWVLRQVLARSVPLELFDRPKMGFGVPIGEWLRGSLRPWAEDLLATDRLVAQGYLDAGTITRMWAEHLSGARDWKYQLWGVLVFQAWLEEWT